MHQPVWDNVERRRFERKKAISNARIRRVDPHHPEIHNVYTRDLTPFGAAFDVKEAAIFTPGDTLRVVFVIKLNPKVIRVHYRLSKVVWAWRGRLGVQFQFDEHGMPLK